VTDTEFSPDPHIIFRRGIRAVPKDDGLMGSEPDGTARIEIEGTEDFIRKVAESYIKAILNG
jgi:hypothetical protein